MQWLAAEQLSLALTTYHVGGIILLGNKPDGRASVHVAAFDRSMGCWTDGQTMWLVTERMLWRLENDLAEGQVDAQGYDRVFVPRVGYTIGEVDGHEVDVDAAGRPVFVNTAFSCLATIDERHNFRPLWQPPFISQLAPEDRCHLSGLAMADGSPKYVSMHAKSDVADGWRDFRETGGLVIDVQSNQVAGEGLSMPHSPRMHDGKLWLLNSGTGHLGFIDPQSGRLEQVTFLPGYARGLSFHGKIAIVGLSKPRREYAFQGLPLEQNLQHRGAAPQCGIVVVDLANGNVLHWARIESQVEELFDVKVLPGVSCPKVLSFATPDYARQMSFELSGRLQRWTIASQDDDSPPMDVLAAPSVKPDRQTPQATSPQQAKSLNNLGLKQREEGNLSAARNCFEQAVALDPRHVGALNNLGNTLRHDGRLEEAVETYRRALQVDPQYARAYLNLGHTLAELGRELEAGGCFRRALKIDPLFVEAGVGLGMVFKEQGRFDEAVACFEQALKLDPRCSLAFNGLGLVQRERDDLNAALACYQHALSIDPRAAAVLANLGSLLREQGQFAEALDCYDRAIAIESDCVPAHHNRSLLKLLIGDYPSGWPEYEWRLKQPRKRVRYTDRPRWDGRPLEGQTLLLHTEQGLGDTLQFIRFAQRAAERGGRVVVQCQVALVELIRSCTGISEVVGDDQDPGGFDLQLPLMSLPAVLGIVSESCLADQVPYLSAEEQRLQQWAAWSEQLRGKKIGIAWQGNPKYPHDRQRSIPLAEFAPLGTTTDITLVSLQVGFGSEQVRQVSGEFEVIEPSGAGNPGLDFGNTAALIRNLDMVITSDTSICHLAGALGTPVWVALPLAADWRFLLQRDDSPWYPNMLLFRQQTRGDWGDVFRRISAECQRLAPCR